MKSNDLIEPELFFPLYKNFFRECSIVSLQLSYLQREMGFNGKKSTIHVNKVCHIRFKLLPTPKLVSKS